MHAYLDSSCSVVIQQVFICLAGLLCVYLSSDNKVIIPEYLYAKNKFMQLTKGFRGFRVKHSRTIHMYRTVELDG